MKTQPVPITPNFELKSEKYLILNCVMCEKPFDRLISVHKAKTAKGGKPFCSRSCNGKYHTTVNPVAARTKPQSLIDKIVELDKRGMTSYEIADELQISRNTVMKYWTGLQHY